MSAAGSSTAGLLHYVYGPGKGESLGGTAHVNPRTVAAWDGAPGLHSPVPIPGRGRTGSGVSVKALARSLDDPVSAAISRVPTQHVGHIIVANHPDDPILTDGQWAEIAAATMANAGLSAGPDDPAGVRWIAVRHDDTSVHIVYTKAREDGTAAPKFINFTKAWQGMRHDFERRFALTSTGKADGTARQPYGQVEATRAKAARAAGDLDARPVTAELRHWCTVVAAEVSDFDTYRARLADAGVLVQDQVDDRGQRTGYRVALSAPAASTTAAGSGGAPTAAVVFYNAGKLAPEISLASLEDRWASGSPVAGEVPGSVDQPPTDAVVAEALARATAAADAAALADWDELALEEVDELIAGTGELLHTAAAATGEDGLREASERFTRAGRTPSRGDHTAGAHRANDRNTGGPAADSTADGVGDARTEDTADDIADGHADRDREPGHGPSDDRYGNGVGEDRAYDPIADRERPTPRRDLAWDLRAASSVLAAIARVGRAANPNVHDSREAARLMMAMAALIAAVEVRHIENRRDGHVAAAAAAGRSFDSSISATLGRRPMAEHASQTTTTPDFGRGSATTPRHDRPHNDPPRYEPPTPGPDRGRGR